MLIIKELTDAIYSIFPRTWMDTLPGGAHGGVSGGHRYVGGGRMNCPHCKTQTRHIVKETRLRDGDIVRSRCCGHCGKVFGTRESVDSTLKFGTGRGNNPNSHNKPIDVLRVWK